MPRILMAGLSAELAALLEDRLGGVAVRATRSVEDTLEELARGDCSLLIVDYSVMDQTASDVLIQAHDRLAVNELPVVYCLKDSTDTALAGTLLQQTGVAGLVFHPLDGEQLARHVASILGLPLPPAVTEEKRFEQEISAAVAAVWERFKENNLGRVTVLDQAANALLEGKLGGELRRQAEREAHKLAGSAGTFGFAKGSRLAREIEYMFQAGESLGQDQAQRLSQLVRALRQELAQTVVGLAPTPTPAGESTMLLVVDDDVDLAERLVMEATSRGMRAVAATSLSAAREAVARERPDAVILDLCFPDEAEDGLDLLAELGSFRPPVPVLVLTVKDTFIDRVEVARLGGRGFLPKPIPPADVMEAVDRLLQQCRAAEARIMAVDDDPQVLATLRALLEPKGLRLTTLNDPLRFWEALGESPPDLLVLDLDMPHVSGIELCRVVRNDQRWDGLPVLFLTSHTDPETKHRIFAAGADDYLSKPIVEPELVTRIVNRLERTKLHRNMAETDPLTGLANRRKSVQVLGQFLRLAERYAQPLCLAIMDLDRFKQVNDRYGHVAGDEVLRRLGEVLLHTFRGEDVVARWGGEEFLVGMYGMTWSEGVQRLSEVLEAMRFEEFTLQDGAQFRVTFSAGVAQYPRDGTDLQALCRAADVALYRAKETGRNRVIPAGCCVGNEEGTG